MGTEDKQDTNFEKTLRSIMYEVLEEKFGDSIDEICKKLDKYESTLYGNGKEGLTTTVSRLDRWATSVQKTINDVVTWVLIAVLGGSTALLLILSANHGLIK